MSDTSATDRRQQFEEEIAAVRIRTGKAESEQRLAVVGLVLLGLGVAITVIAYFMSTGTSFTNDILELVILALFGVALSVTGAALFLRYSFARFLRFWLLRMIYEQQESRRP